MFTLSFITGVSTILPFTFIYLILIFFYLKVENGWLSKEEFDPVIKSAWAGLLNAIPSNGMVKCI